MTGESFAKALVEYFGPYPSEFTQEMVARHVESIPERERQVLLEFIFKSVSGTYRHTPDVATIERVRAETEQDIRRRTGQWYTTSDGSVFVGDREPREIGSFWGKTFHMLVGGSWSRETWDAYRALNVKSPAQAIEFLAERKLLPPEIARRALDETAPNRFLLRHRDDHAGENRRSLPEMAGGQQGKSDGDHPRKRA